MITVVIIDRITPIDFYLDFVKAIFFNFKSSSLPEFEFVAHENVDGPWSCVNLLVLPTYIFRAFSNEAFTTNTAYPSIIFFIKFFIAINAAGLIFLFLVFIIRTMTRALRVLGQILTFLVALIALFF